MSEVNPSLKLYSHDWLSETASLTLDEIGLLITLLHRARLGYPFGYIVNGSLVNQANNNGTAVPDFDRTLTRLCGRPERQWKRLLPRLESGNWIKKLDDGSLVSPWLIRKEEIRAKRAANGAKGGNPHLMSDEVKVNQINRAESEAMVNQRANPHPSPSPSPSPECSFEHSNHPPLPPKGGSPRQSRIDLNENRQVVEEAMAWWNDQVAPVLQAPRIESLDKTRNKTRLGHLLQRLKDTPDFYNRVLEEAHRTAPKFLGMGERGGFLTFDYLTVPSKLTKFLEGNYRAREAYIPGIAPKIKPEDCSQEAIQQAIAEFHNGKSS